MDKEALQADLATWKQAARSSVLEANQAAEEFRQDFKAFLSQLLDPMSWQDGLKIVMGGGLGLLKDLEEMVCRRNWSPDKLVAHLDQNIDRIVQKHPELQEQWDNVKVSFHFTKMKTDEALARIKDSFKREYGKFDQSKVVAAAWKGVKGEIQKDLSDLMARFKGHAS